MPLEAEHRRFLTIEQGAVPVVINFLLNGAIAWALFRGASSVPLWGESSLGVDLLVTGFLLPFATCLIVSPLVARQVRSGKVQVLPAEARPHSGWFRRSPATRGVLLGAAGVVFGALPVVAALTLGAAQPFPVTTFVAFKAAWAALLAGALAPWIGWWALAHASATEI